MFVWLIQWVCINIGEKKTTTNKQNCSDWCAMKQHDVSWFSLVWFLILWCTCFMVYAFLFLYFFGTENKQDSDSCWNKNLFNMNLAAFLSFPPCRPPLPPAPDPIPPPHFPHRPKKLHGFERSFLSLLQTRRINYGAECKMKIWILPTSKSAKMHNDFFKSLCNMAADPFFSNGHLRHCNKKYPMGCV